MDQTLSILDGELGIPMLPEKKHSLYAFAQKGVISEDERLELRKSGIYRFLPQFCRLKFAEQQQETLYEAYYTSQKQADLVAFVVSAICFQLFCAITYATRGLDLKREEEKAALGFLVAAFIFNCVVIVIYKLQIIRLKDQKRFKQLFPFLVFAVLYANFFLDMLTTHHPLLMSDGVSFQILFIYVTMTMLPLRLVLCTILAIGSSVSVLILHALQAQGFGEREVSSGNKKKFR